MSSPWKEMPADIPADEAEVWVRLRWWVPPFHAVWSLDLQTFVHESGLSFPWWEIVRWKPIV